MPTAVLVVTNVQKIQIDRVNLISAMQPISDFFDPAYMTFQKLIDRYTVRLKKHSGYF